MPHEDVKNVASLLDSGAVARVRASASVVTTPAPSDPETDDLAFENGAYRYAADWLVDHADTCSQAKPFAFLCSRSIAADKELLSSNSYPAKKYDAFRHQKGNDITSSVVFATVNFEQALVVPVTDVADAQSLFDMVAAVGCQDRILAVLEPAQANLIIRRSTGKSLSIPIKPPGLHAAWKLDQLEAAITNFHNDFTRTPSGVLVPWRSAADGLTADRLEVRISKNLAWVLDRNFAKGSVLAEAETSSGRMDVFIVPNVLESGAAVIEVKVLRSHQGIKKKVVDPKFNVWWAKKGVVQADLYRKDKSASDAYLCCFDGRESDADMPDVESAAAARNVRSKRYFMYRSTADLQGAELCKIDTESATSSDGAASR